MHEETLYAERACEQAPWLLDQREPFETVLTRAVYSANEVYVRPEDVEANDSATFWRPGRQPFCNGSPF